MADDGLQDMIGIMNVGLSATGQLGKVAVNVTKGSIWLLIRLLKLFQCIHDHPYHQVSGKTDMKVLGAKFQDLRYNEFKFSLGMTEVQKRLDAGDKIDIKKAEKLLSESALQKKFEEFAKKAGLLYSRVPNFVVNKETGKIEYRVAFSVAQQEAYLEVTSQMLAYIKKTLKKVGIEEKISEQIAEEIVSEDKPFVNAVDEIGIAEVSDEVYEEKLQETYADYDPQEIIPVPPAEEKKTDYETLSDMNEYKSQKKKGNVKEFTYSNVLQKQNARVDEWSFVMEDHPNVCVTLNLDDILKLDRYDDTRGKIAVRKDRVCQFDVVYVDPVTKQVDRTKSPQHYEMTFTDFEKMMNQNTEKTAKKVAALLETKAALPAIKNTPAGRSK